MSLRKALHRQWTAAVACSLSVIVLGTSLGWPSPVLTYIIKTGEPYNLTTEEISWMVSLLYLGNLISPIPAGMLMDRIGRKRSLLVLAIAPVTSWIIVYFATNAWYLHVARFLAGSWSGAVSTITPMYLSEICDPKIRGALSTLIQLMTNAGVLFEYIVGPRVSYGTLAIVTGSLPILFILVFVWMPESPYWLVMKNRSKEETAKTLSWLYADWPTSEAIEGRLADLTKTVAEDEKNTKTWYDLFGSRGHRRALLIVEVLAILQRMSGISALMAYTSTTLPNRPIGPLTVDDCVVIMGAIWLFSVFLATVLVDRLGRRPLLLISCSGSGLTMLTAGLWFYFDSNGYVDVTRYYWIPFASFVLYGVFFCVGLGPIASTVQGEMFPTNIRGLASGVTSVSLALTSLVFNKLYHPIALSVGMYLNYFIFSAASFLGAVFTLVYVIETKGKTFTEIQEQLETKRSRRAEYQLAQTKDNEIPL